MSSGSPEELHLSADGSEEHIVQHVARLLRVLKQRRAYVGLALAFTTALGILYYSTATQRYEATASLLVSPGQHDMLSATDSTDHTISTLIPTYEQLLLRPVVLQGALDRLEPLPLEARIDFTGTPKHEWLDELRQHLSATSIRRTNLIEVSYRSRSPHSAEAVVAAIIKSYMDFTAQHHKDVSIELVETLDNERQELEQQLAKTQRSLLVMKRRVRDFNNKDDPEIVHPTLQQAIAYHDSLLETRKERIQLESTLAAIHSAIERKADLRQHLITVEPMVGRELVMSALGLNPQYAEVTGEVESKLIAERAKLESLSKHLGTLHPQIIELKQSVAHREHFLADYQSTMSARLTRIQDDQLAPMLVSMVQEKLADAHSHEQQLKALYEAAEEEVASLNDQIAEIQITNSEFKRLAKLHETLLTRISKIGINENQAAVRVSVVGDPTAKDQPVSPQLAWVTFFCLSLGLFIGATLAYVTDLLDDRFRTPEELRNQLGVPVLAMIRKLRDNDRKGINGLHVHSAMESVENEAFRTLRTTLSFSGQDLDCVAITSSEPGDGKTTVISNLAGTYAQAGKRTLLIDADLRRPGLSKLLGIRGKKGLSDLLRNDELVATYFEKTVQTTEISNLDILPCGISTSSSTELLSHPRLEEFLAWAESLYDQVLIDCPPMLAASDAAIVGRLVRGVVVVVDPKKNHRRAVLRAVDSLRSLHVNLVGVVANRVDNTKDSEYYGYGYGDGYQENPGEDDSLEAGSSTHPILQDHPPLRPHLTKTDRDAA